MDSRKRQARDEADTSLIDLINETIRRHRQWRSLFDASNDFGAVGESDDDDAILSIAGKYEDLYLKALDRLEKRAAKYETGRYGRQGGFTRKADFHHPIANQRSLWWDSESGLYADCGPGNGVYHLTDTLFQTRRDVIDHPDTMIPDGAVRLV